MILTCYRQSSELWPVITNKLTFDPNWTKIESGWPMVTRHLPWKFHANRSSRFLVMLPTKKQRNRPKTIPRPYRGRGNNCMLYKLFCALLSTDSIYDSCMMSIFTCEAVQNVYIQFRCHLNWLGTLFHFIPAFYLVLYNYVFMPLAKAYAGACSGACC